MKEKLSAKDKRLLAYANDIQTRVLYPNYESRITLAQLFDDLKPESLVTGRKCTGSKKVLDKKTGKVNSKLKYSVNRKFVVFNNGERLSVSNAIFAHLKTDQKLPHEFENYYA